MNNFKSRGQSLVEFAILLPVFLIIVLGIFDLGRVIYDYSALHNAAREGARYGAVNHCDNNGIIAAARHYAVGLGDGVEVYPDIIYSLGVPVQIKVRVVYPFRTITPLVGVFLGADGSIPLQSESHQHIELPTLCD